MRRGNEREQGFMLVGLLVALFLMLLALSIAAPTVARHMQRERELETVRRGNQYVRAIRVYYKKFGHYPASIEQLEKTNNIRFLRHRYVDPLTNKDDWRIIHVGQNQTQVKGFFGQPLAGLPGPGGAGSSFGSSSTSTTTGGSAGGGFTSFGSSLLGGGSGTSATGTSGATPAAGTGTTGSATSGTGSSSSFGASSPGTGISSAPSGFGSGTSSVGPIMGIGLAHQGSSLIVVNDQTTYDTWEFLYDPRSEPKPAIGSGVGTAGSSSSSSGFGSSSPGVGSGTSGSGSFGGSTTGGSSTNGGSTTGGSTNGGGVMPSP